LTSAQAKISQMKYIDWDAEMVHPVDGELVHAKARSLSVTDLGQVKYIFSDKTGTLTRNEMKLRRVVVRGKCYGLGEKHDEVCAADYGEKTDPLTCKALYDLAQEQGKTDSEAWCARKMLESFMLCNTVIVEQPEEDDDRVHYQAESPDEGALVEGGKMCGYTLSARTQKELVGSVGPPHSPAVTTKYEILATNEFDNDRKRMSIVLRDLQTQKIVFFCKGADSSMLERADPASIERSGDFTKTIDAYAVRISAF
jgi:magnesium-transporting ATPase (P-type)